MISRRLFHLGNKYTPTWELRFWRGLDSWLIGVRWARHDHSEDRDESPSWHAELHLGPAMLRLEHMKSRSPRLRDGIEQWMTIRWWDFARTRGGYEHPFIGSINFDKPLVKDIIVQAGNGMSLPGSVEWVPWSNWAPPYPTLEWPTIRAQRGGIKFLRPPSVSTPGDFRTDP